MKEDPKHTGQGVSLQGYDLRELLSAGHAACPGCGSALALRLALKALGPDSIMVIPRSCTTFSMGPFPYTGACVSILHAAEGTAAASASGVRAALDQTGKKETTVVAWADADDALGAGLPQLIEAALRDEDIIYVLCDSSSPSDRKNRSPIDDIVAAHEVPYRASTTPALPMDLDGKFKKARSLRGFRFIHVIAACPARHGCDPSKSVEIMRDAALSGEFAIYEAESKSSMPIKTDE